MSGKSDWLENYKDISTGQLTIANGIILTSIGISNVNNCTAKDNNNVNNVSKLFIHNLNPILISLRNRIHRKWIKCCF